eukprot:1848264-Alexandrium_andersonii.AAC.1
MVLADGVAHVLGPAGDDNGLQLRQTRADVLEQSGFARGAVALPNPVDLPRVDRGAQDGQHVLLPRKGVWWEQPVLFVPEAC